MFPNDFENMKKPANPKPLASNLFTLGVNFLSDTGFFGESQKKVVVLTKPLGGILPIQLKFSKDQQSLRLSYPYQQESEELVVNTTAVEIAKTACHFGGHRFWFICPAKCGKRVGKLYYHKGAFACRHCHDVTYKSKHVNPSVRTSDMYKRLRLSEQIIALGSGLSQAVYDGSQTQTKQRIERLRDQLGWYDLPHHLRHKAI